MIAKGFVAVSFFAIVIGMAGVVVVGLGVVVLLTWELGWALVVGGTADVVTAGFVVEEGSQNLSAPAPTHLPGVADRSVVVVTVRAGWLLGLGLLL